MADNLPARPKFVLPFPKGTKVRIVTYVGHNPDDKKMDMYAEGWPGNSAVLASAGGIVHEHFAPGGLEINHGNGWFTTYMHMEQRVAVGTRVAQGQWIGQAGSVGTGAKHLHHEQLFHPGSNDADNGDITYPLFVEQGVNGSPLHLVPGDNHAITMVAHGPVASTPPPAPHTTSPHPLLPAWPLAAGYYFGDVHGPNASVGGYNWPNDPARTKRERAWVAYLQRMLQRVRVAPNTVGWADGVFEQPTTDAVKRLQAKLHLPVTGRITHADAIKMGLWR